MDPNNLLSMAVGLRSSAAHLDFLAQEADKDAATIRQQAGEIQTLEAAKQDLLVRVGQLEAENLDHSQEIARLQTQIDQLNAELDRYRVKPPPPPPPPPPIEVSPDITISLGGFSFRPGLKGDRQGKETRYRGSFNSEVNVLVDIKDDGQIAVCIERCKATLPTTAEVLSTRLGIEIGSEVAYDGAFRLHHHTRPRIPLNPSQPPNPHAQAQALISSGLLPNFNLISAKPTEDDLSKIAAGRYPWETWQGKMVKLGADYDRISEEYGQVVNSWTGGAGPLMNEAAHLMPVQLAYLASGDSRAWLEVVKLANSSGNYAVHYQLEGGRFPRADETGSLPFLQGDLPVTLRTASGAKTLPVPEPAHEHSLVYLAYLLTGERWYREELEAWSRYNLLTRPKGELRLKGILHSGQERATAWALRALLHASLSMSRAFPGTENFYSAELISNLNWMRDTFTIPGKPNYYQTGVTSPQAFRAAPLLKFVTLLPRPKYISTWNYHILASVLNECVRAGFKEAMPMLGHVTKVARGQWQHGLSKYHIGWGNHAFNLDRWNDIIRTTFEGRTAIDPPMDRFPEITTPDYVAWARSAVVAAVDAGQGEEWANEALEWIDTEAPKYKGGIPAVWRIDPV